MKFKITIKYPVYQGFKITMPNCLLIKTSEGHGLTDKISTSDFLRRHFPPRELTGAFSIWEGSFQFFNCLECKVVSARVCQSTANCIQKLQHRHPSKHKTNHHPTKEWYSIFKKIKANITIVVQNYEMPRQFKLQFNIENLTLQAKSYSKWTEK